MLTAFVLIRAEPARIADLASQLTDLDGIAEVYSVAGDHDLVAIVRVRDHDDLGDVVTGSIAGREGVLSTLTLVAFRAYSKRDTEAMWSIGLDQP